MADFIAEIPQDIGHGAATLQEVACAGKVCGEVIHVLPPGLSSQERGADAVREAGSRGQETDLGIVGVGVEHIVGHSLGHVEVGDFLEHLPVLVPCQGETGETFRSDSRFAIDVGRGGGGVDRFEVEISHIAFAEWLPELAHRDIGVFEILHGIHRDNVAAGGLELDLKAFRMGEVGHFLKEVLAIEDVDRPPPVNQELARLLLAVKYIAHKGRKLFLQVVPCGFLEILLHRISPGLGVALPTVHQHAVGTVLQRTVLQHSDIVGELDLSPLRIKLAALPAGCLRRSGGVAFSGVDMADPQDCPSPLGRIGRRGSPVQTAVRGHLVGDVDNVLGLDKCQGILLRVLLVHLFRYQCPAGLSSPTVLPGGGPETDETDAGGVGIC